ncbi:hypothetical protein M5K25_007367 [Dendrobium thyrsiflorum]|uniref:Uncharacterized protein n=1 Tax=Dendrobium thyrsiflorum TaxID=117978 RepID=A0ABD0VF60_DENTH
MSKSLHKWRPIPIFCGKSCSNLEVLQSGAERRIEQLDETNPTSPITHNSDISKSENYPSNRPRSRDLTSESRERSETALASLLLLDHRRSSTEPQSDHHLKARRPAGPPPEGLTPDVLPDHHLKARRPTGPPPKARRYAGPPPDARRSVGPPPEARHSAGPPPEA